MVVKNKQEKAGQMGLIITFKGKAQWTKELPLGSTAYSFTLPPNSTKLGTKLFIHGPVGDIPHPNYSTTFGLGDTHC
jgi:hypothetical protein